MWYQSSNANETTIPPNLLKNFNPFVVLEPEKDGAKNSAANKVDKLIDIDEDSGFHETDFNGLVENRSFNLVDLYENILVSPQHVSQNRSASNDNVTNVATSLDIDFTQFFDKLEAGQKFDGLNIAQSQEETISKRCSNVLVEKPRVLVPKVFTEPDSDPEDLIHEVLTQKNIEKRVLSEIYHSPKENFDNSKNIKDTDVTNDFSRLSLNNNLTKHSKFENGSHETEPNTSESKTCPVNSQINTSLTNFTVRALQKDAKNKKKSLVKPECQKALFTKGPDFNEKLVVLPQIMARLNARQAYLDEISNYKKRLVLDSGASTKPFVKAECSKSVVNEKPKSVISVQGYCSVKPESISISKDPRLCMNRVTESIAVHSTSKYCANCSKSTSNTCINGVRSPKTDHNFGKLSPTVLMEDCNKERLRALKQSQLFKDFVLGKHKI